MSAATGNPRRRILKRAPALGLTLIFVGLALIPLTQQDYQVGEWTFALSFGIAAVGLNIMIADAGLVSLGHNAFFAFGAYATAVLARDGWAYWQVLPVVAAMSLVLGWIIGPPIVKLGHLNFALITIGLGFVTPTIALRLGGLTGGANGEALPTFTAPGWTGLTSSALLYYVGLVVLLVCVLLTIGIRRSQAGRALRAQRDNEVAAEAFGVRLARMRCGVFAMSVMMCGIGGWLWGITSSYVAPDSFDSTLSISMLAGVVVGGLGLAASAIFAGAFVEFLLPISSHISAAFGGLVQGLIIVVVVLIVRQGVFGLLHRAFGWALRGRSAPAARAAPPSAEAPGPVEAPDLQPTTGQREPA
jgi:branched-chain amino acid transport system permease protein